VPAYRTGPLIGLIGQVVLLAALAVTIGLGPGGWLVGVGFGVFTCIALTRGLNRSGASALGPADRVTLARATLVGAIAALTVDSLYRHVPLAVLVAVAAVALTLDAVDGKVARRTGTVSAFGARFDMEVDAFLILVFSVYLSRPVGPWVLAIGGMRYAFVLAGWVLPWMRAALPPRYWRKVVAATQGIVLMVATAGVLPGPLATAALAVALALLVESFGRDIGWLWRRRPAVFAVPAASRFPATTAPRPLAATAARGPRPATTAARRELATAAGRRELANGPAVRAPELVPVR
jgi:phosphatidylglycerophosphate synthase